MAKSRKLPIERRETTRQRATTFSKRRQGLFNKAAEISMLCDARVAVLVSSLASSKQKLYSFGYPYVDAVFDIFLQNRVIDDALDHDKTKTLAFYLWEETMGLDHCTQKINKRNKSSERFYLDLEELEKLNSVQDLQVLAKALENLRDKAVTKMQTQWSTSVGATAIVGNDGAYQLDATIDDNSDNWHLGHADNGCVLDGTGFFNHSPSSLIADNSLVAKTELPPDKTPNCNNFNWFHSATAIKSGNCDDFNGTSNNDGPGQHFNTTDDDPNFFFGTDLITSSFDVDQDYIPFEASFGDIDEAFLQAEIFKNNKE